MVRVAAALVVFVSAVAVAGLASARQTAANLLQNPGVEGAAAPNDQSSVSPEGWTTTGSFTAVRS